MILYIDIISLAAMIFSGWIFGFCFGFGYYGIEVSFNLNTVIYITLFYCYFRLGSGFQDYRLFAERSDEASMADIPLDGEGDDNKSNGNKDNDRNNNDNKINDEIENLLANEPSLKSRERSGKNPRKESNSPLIKSRKAITFKSRISSGNFEEEIANLKSYKTFIMYNLPNSFMAVLLSIQSCINTICISLIFDLYQLSAQSSLDILWLIMWSIGNGFAYVVSSEISTLMARSHIKRCKKYTALNIIIIIFIGIILSITVYYLRHY